MACCPWGLFPVPPSECSYSFLLIIICVHRLVHQVQPGPLRLTCLMISFITSVQRWVPSQQMKWKSRNCDREKLRSTFWGFGTNKHAANKCTYPRCWWYPMGQLFSQEQCRVEQCRRVKQLQSSSLCHLTDTLDKVIYMEASSSALHTSSISY
jgi:hypothetical protein